MALTDFDATEKVTLDPERTRCACRKSVLLPALPHVHCPSCHATYRARNLGRPAFCAHCGFNLRAWRARNGIEEVAVPMP